MVEITYPIPDFSSATAKVLKFDYSSKVRWKLIFLNQISAWIKVVLVICMDIKIGNHPEVMNNVKFVKLSFTLDINWK